MVRKSIRFGFWIQIQTPQLCNLVLSVCLFPSLESGAGGGGVLPRVIRRTRGDNSGDGTGTVLTHICAVSFTIYYLEQGLALPVLFCFFL